MALLRTLTDVQLPEIQKMKSESHPMQAKKDLARIIVTDFHSADAATKAAEDWAKQFQKSEVPEDVEETSGFNRGDGTRTGSIGQAVSAVRAGRVRQ